jgi:hypothetical protein
LLGALLAHEQHPGSIAAIWPQRFLLMNPATGEIGAIRNRQPHRPIRFHNIMRRAVMMPKCGFLIAATPHRTVTTKMSVSTPE